MGVDRTAAFTAAKAARDELERAERAAAQRLRAVPGVGSGAMGLTPDLVKQSPEYRAASAAHAAAFKLLRDFNAAFVRQFATELRQERRERYFHAYLRRAAESAR